MKHQLISGEALLNTYSKGNPEGSRSNVDVTIDPVTTDPKGEAHRNVSQHAGYLLNKKGLWRFYDVQSRVYTRVD